MQKEAIANLNDQINTLQEDLKASQETEKKLRSENESLKKQIEELAQDNKQMKQRQSVLETDVKKYQTMAESAIQQAAEQRARELSNDDTLKLRGSVTSIKKLKSWIEWLPTWMMMSWRSSIYMK